MTVTPRLSGNISMTGLVLIVLKSLLGTARQWSREKFVILSPKVSEPCYNFDTLNEGYSYNNTVESR